MTTGTKIVQRALGKIGAHSPLQPAPPESIEAAKDTLNSMISEWYDDGIDLGAVPLNAVGDELSEPSGARNAIQNCLAVTLAPDFPNAQVSTELVKQANKGFMMIESIWGAIEIPKSVGRETRPMGQGTKLYRWQDGFLTQGSEIGS